MGGNGLNLCSSGLGKMAGSCEHSKYKGKNSTVMGYYAVSNGNFLLTFRDNLLVQW
jgi:hypothetical protein